MATTGPAGGRPSEVIVKPRTKSSGQLPQDLLRLSAELEALKRNRSPRQPVPKPLREHALMLIASGVTPKEVAGIIGATPEVVRLWRRRAESVGQLPAAAATSQVSSTPVAAVAPDGSSSSPATRPSATMPIASVSEAPSRQALVSGLSAVEAAEILSWKKDHPSMGPAQIQAQIKRFKGWRLSIKAIARTLTTNGYERVHVGSRPQGDEVPRRWEAPHRNAVWQADFAELRVGAEKTPVLLVLDDFSRYVVGCRLMPEPTSEEVVELLQEAIRKHGKPERLYTDRGGPFMAWRQESSLGQFLERELIDHSKTPAYKPQGRGKVEALVHTLRRELWELVEFGSPEEAREGLRKFFDDYNHRRAHMGLDGLTPADRFFGRSDEVAVRVEHACRRREARDLSPSAPALPYTEERGEASGALEVLRFVVVDGKVEMRLFGARLALGALRS